MTAPWECSALCAVPRVRFCAFLVSYRLREEGHPMAIVVSRRTFRQLAVLAVTVLIATLCLSSGARKT